MKKLILALFAFGLFSFSSSNFSSLLKSSTDKVETVEAFACKNGQCQGTAKSTGKQCKRCVSNDGDKFCYQHK